MKSYIALLTAFLLPAGAAVADTKLTVQGMLDNVCVAGRLDGQRLGPDVQIVAKAMNMKAQALPAEALPTVNPDATEAWLLGSDDQTFIFAFAVKEIEGGRSSSCSVTSQVSAEDVAAIKTHIERRYKVKKIAEQEQGPATITAYKGDLVGFPSPRHFGVQHVHPGEGIQEMVMVSFFDSP